MKLNQYEWNPETDLIAAGAFAEVFRAKDAHHQNRFVALKIYKEGIAQGTTKGTSGHTYTLEKEFRKIDGLSHTNIISFYGLDYIVSQDALGRSTRHPVIIMEYASEGTLSAFLKTRPSQQLLDKIITDVIEGVGYLHKEAIIHRDLKPGNILITRNRRGEPVAKITDFGISRDMMEEKNAEQTLTEGVGTPHYMAPEQFYKKRFGIQGEISPQTDLWALGIIIYRMLAGKRPFAHESKDYEIIRNAIVNEAPDLSPIPEKYKRPITACLEKKAADRVASTSDLLGKLTSDDSYDEEDLTVLPTAVPKAKNDKKSKKKALPLLLGLVVLLLAATAFFFYQNTGTGELAVVKLNEKFGYINKDGEEAIPFKYDGAWSISEGYALVLSDKKWGFIDGNGKTTIPLNFENAQSFSEGLAAVQMNGKWGFINKDGAIVINPEYEDAHSFSEGLAPVKTKDHWGYINKENTIMIPPKYENAYVFSEGVAVVRIGQREGFINKKGDLVIPATYDYVLAFSEGLAAVNVGGAWGYINKQGSMSIPTDYEQTWGFSEGLAPVKQDGKWGFINKLGDLAIGPKYDDASGFSNGLAGVRLHGKEGFIDKDDKVVIDFKYEYADVFSAINE